MLLSVDQNVSSMISKVHSEHLLGAQNIVFVTFFDKSDVSALICWCDFHI